MIAYDRSVSSIDSHQEAVPVYRCLVNVGEGTQRFCSERRIKLASISCIVVTSLAPHNLSGFSGVFLSLSDLGVGKLTVIGPCGLQSCLDIMLPIINRKYPVLEVVEIDRDTPVERLTTVTEHWVVRAYPLFPNEACSKVLAIAADIISAEAWASSTPGNTNSSSPVTVCTTFPVPYYFEPTPTLEVVAELGGQVLQSKLGTFKRAFLFSRLGVASFDSGREGIADVSEQRQRLRRLCEAHDACGIVDTGNLSDSVIETGYSQAVLGVLHRLCRPLFPDAAQPVRAIRDAVLGGADANSANKRDSAESDGVNDGRLRPAVPMLRLLEWDAATHPAGRWETTDSVRATAHRGAEQMRLCEEAVLSHLQQLLHAAKPSHHRVASAPIPLIPPPPPPPSEPPMLARNFTFGGSSSDAQALAYPSMPPPSFPPSWSGVSFTSGSASVEASGSSNASPLLGAPLSLSVSTSDASETATPAQSPGTNFAAASLIRSNLLQKRKLHLGDTNLPPVHSAGSTPKGLPSPLLAGGALSSEADADDSTPRTSPLKSLRLGDSARQPIFFPDTLPVSPLYAVLPTPTTIHTLGTAPETPHKGIAEQSESGSSTDGQAPPVPAHLRNPTPSSRVWPETTEHSVFSIPPPNPNTDICTVTFLGTGSAKPSKFRNGSCIMLSLNTPHGEPFGNVPEVAGRLAIDTRVAAGNQPQTANSTAAPRKQIILLDVGEGTAAQMFQSVGCDAARFDELLLSIKLIWISHHHADHMTGVPMLLEQIKRARLRRQSDGDGDSGDDSEAASSRKSIRRVPTVSKYDMRSMFASGGYEAGKVMIIGSEAVLKYFEFTACVAGLDDLVTFSPIVKTLYAGETKEIAAATEGVITRLRSIPVQHCQGSYGLVLDFKSTHKVVYSGDCRPSQSLVKAGLDCDLLIHEATFDETMYDDAVKKRHSTSAEARRVAGQMRAKHTVLTHFSQRYPLEASTATGLALTSTAQHSRSTGDLAQFALTGGREACLPRPAVAYDFLRFSFPSQAADLPRATEAVGVVLAELEAQRKTRT